MALLNANDFSGYSDSFAAPAGSNDPIFAGSVDLILSTGITQQVFDSLSSALKCIHYMEANNSYSLSPNEDVTVLNLRSKLLILENTYINQKMINSYVFTYHGAQVRAIHRSMADTITLTTVMLYQVLDLDVLGSHGVPTATQKWRLIGLIKTGLVSRWLIICISHQIYLILIY